MTSDRRLHHELPLRPPHPFGVTLLKYALVVTLGCASIQDNMEKFGSLIQTICQSKSAMEKHMLNHHKSRHTYQVKVDCNTLGPKGTESGHHGFMDLGANGQMVPGLRMAPKVLRSIYGVEPGKPNALPEIVGRSSVRKDDGAVGRG